MDIEGATAATYTLTLDDVGHTIRLEVSFTDDLGFAETRASAATSVLIVPTAGIVRVPHDWALIPPQSNLGAGGQFRLMFVTAHPDVTGANRERFDLIDATSTDIATYNEFVQQAAFGGHADIQAYAGHFRALASTAAVNARDNTATTATDTDTAVYWLGRRGDNQNTIARFYGAGNARWKQRETQRDDDGNALTMGFNDFVWTGTATDGTTDSAPLGSARPAHAEPAHQFGQMDNGQNERDNTVELPLYALSGVFEVAAEPGGSGERGVSGGPAPERAATGAARDGDSDPALGDGRAPGDANVDGIATDEAIPRGPGVVVGGRLPALDIVLPADADPTGLWSDGRTMWVVSDRGAGEVTTWSLADGRALGAGEVLLADGATRALHRFTLTGGGGDPAGLWSDGATLWVADALGGVRAYRLSDGRRMPDGDIAEEVLAAAGNHRPTGLWSDGGTLWVADNGAWKVFAYALPDRRRAADREFELADRAGALLSPWGLWSDGATLLVSNHFDGGVLGFALADGAPRPDLRGGTRRRAAAGRWGCGRTGAPSGWCARATAASAPMPRPGCFHAASRGRRRTCSPCGCVTRADAVPRGPAAGAPAFIADAALRAAVAAALDLEPHEAVRVRAMAALRLARPARRGRGRSRRPGTRRESGRARPGGQPRARPVAADGAGEPARARARRRRGRSVAAGGAGRSAPAVVARRRADGRLAAGGTRGPGGAGPVWQPGDRPAAAVHHAPAQGAAPRRRGGPVAAGRARRAGRARGGRAAPVPRARRAGARRASAAVADARRRTGGAVAPVRRPLRPEAAPAACDAVPRSGDVRDPRGG